MKQANHWNRLLLSVEWTLAFGPVAVLLLYGLLVSPALLLDEKHETSLLPLMIMILGGSWGLIASGNLAVHVLIGRRWAGKPLQWLGLAAGTMACGVALWLCLTDLKSAYTLVFLLAPVLVTCHFLSLTHRQAAHLSRKKHKSNNG